MNGESVTQPPTLLHLTRISATIWIGALLFCLLLVGIAAGVLAQARLATVELAVTILVIVEAVVGCIAVASVFLRSKGYLHSFKRVLWIVGFTLLQLITSLILALGTLLVFNR